MQTPLLAHSVCGLRRPHLAVCLHDDPALLCEAGQEALLEEHDLAALQAEVLVRLKVLPAAGMPSHGEGLLLGSSAGSTSEHTAVNRTVQPAVKTCDAAHLVLCHTTSPDCQAGVQPRSAHGVMAQGSYQRRQQAHEEHSQRLVVREPAGHDVPVQGLAGAARGCCGQLLHLDQALRLDLEQGLA
jgi:hypothetical protein